MPTPPITDSQFALWVIIPVKPFGEGKSRLSTILSPTMRADLSRQWLTHLLSIVIVWGRSTGIAVISRDTDVLEMAGAMGALPVLETGDDLNVALEQVCHVVAAAGAEGVLMLPSDLPFLTTADLDELYTLALNGEGAIIAPSHDGGTNALLLRPPHAIPFAFGEDSCNRHQALAIEAGLVYTLYHSPTLALDIDHPEDLLQVKESPRLV